MEGRKRRRQATEAGSPPRQQHGKNVEIVDLMTPPRQLRTLQAPPPLQEQHACVDLTQELGERVEDSKPAAAVDTSKLPQHGAKVVDLCDENSYSTNSSNPPTNSRSIGIKRPATWYERHLEELQREEEEPVSYTHLTLPTKA